MSRSAICPACGANDLDVCRYDAMMVLRTDLALFALRCPHCDASVSIVHSIPPQLRDEVRFAAIEVGAGMGQE
ncbi:UDP-N-acetylmuramoylalanyl-D-glutamate--2,6-diaminopimelate ligase [Paraeggerthella hominis]|uniref:UDP-N-acetylmuramoylalanyl-D-glutamate--2, 6-diaminopimelate ligase n=1 Tax=Paraeggerthella hominis TaxID=2897351 RepID=UPI003D0F5D0D